MTAEGRKIKVLLAQFSLETHSRGIITVAGMLRDSGMEVVYIGNNTPEQIMETAIHEDVDVVGISSYCGGELALGKDLMEAAEKRGVKGEMLFLLGGIFPPADVPKLKGIGFDGTFAPGSTKEEIATFIEKSVTAKARK